MPLVQALSPASIRNVMADLEDEGYLCQPHTSAGRVPTEKAFRSYVQSLSLRRMAAREIDSLRAEAGDASFRRVLMLASGDVCVASLCIGLGLLQVLERDRVGAGELAPERVGERDVPVDGEGHGAGELRDPRVRALDAREGARLRDRCAHDARGVLGLAHPLLRFLDPLPRRISRTLRLLILIGDRKSTRLNSSH